MSTPSSVKMDIDSKKIVIGKICNGIYLEREVGSEEIFSMLSGSVAIESGLLPPNTRYCRITEREALLAIEVPAAKHKIAVQHDACDLNRNRLTIDNVPLPSAIFILRATRDGSSYNLTTGSVYATKNGLSTDEDELFLYPAPNVQSTSQNICWGFDQYRGNGYKYMSLAGFEGAVSLFFRAAFNDHLFERRRLASSFDWSKIKNFRAVEEYFQYLSGLGEFNPDWLVPANLKFSQAIK